MGVQVSVTDLITYVRQRADIEESNFITDEEIIGYLNRSYQKLYDILVKTYEDYYIEDTTITLEADTSSYPLPDNFYKCLGVDLHVSSSQKVTLKPFNFGERNKFQSGYISPCEFYQYKVQGGNIKFIPTPTSGGTVTLWYVPVAETLTSASTIDSVNGYDEFVIVDAAIKCLQKEESDTTALQLEKQEAISRIQSSASNRDAGEPKTVTDVDAQEPYWW